MQNFNDKVLYKTHQHIIVLVFKVIYSNLLISFPIIIFICYFTELWNLVKIIISTLFIFSISFWHYFFWNKSYIIISNQKISMKVRNWLFSKYHMSIYFKNIKDIAYSKNHFLHYLFDYWTFFARSSAWANWDFLATNIPKIEELYKYVNNLYILSEEWRDLVKNLNEIKNNNNSENREDVIKKEINNLLKIKWIKEVLILNNNDKKYIFENEEDRNHWVYESIKRNITLCITHNSEFRDADSYITMQMWKKVIFPVVGFHEVKRSNVVSGSPSLKIHNYLKNKFKYIDKNDATVLIGFDI